MNKTYAVTVEFELPSGTTEREYHIRATKPGIAGREAMAFAMADHPGVATSIVDIRVAR